jgi:hypothetical protein
MTITSDVFYIFLIIAAFAFGCWIGYYNGQYDFVVQTRKQLEDGKKPMWLIRWVR